MSAFYVYKTKKDVIIAIGLGTDGEGTAKLTVFDHHIPPSPAKLIDMFQADSMCDYVNCMIPVLLKNLKDDPEVIEIYERIQREGL